MKIYVIFLVLSIIGCQSKSEHHMLNKSNSTELLQKSEENEKIDDPEKRFRDSLYNRESDNYISKLEEIPDQDSNSYKLTISSKNGKKSFFKILNARPRASLINECNDYYTVVGFSCGGPCSSGIFVFTDENRPFEQYSFAHIVDDLPNIILHIKDEEFENLIIRNLANGKEIVVKNPDIGWQNYGQMNNFYIVGQKLKIEYLTENGKTRKKSISLEKILN